MKPRVVLTGLAAAADVLLVQHLQVRRVNRVLHSLEPVGIEIGMHDNAALAVASRERVVMRDDRQRAAVRGTPSTYPGTLHRDSCLFDVAQDRVSSSRVASREVALGIEEPAMIDARDPALFHAAVQQRGVAVSALVLQQADASTESRKRTSVSPRMRTDDGGVLIGQLRAIATGCQ